MKPRWPLVMDERGKHKLERGILGDRRGRLGVRVAWGESGVCVYLPSKSPLVNARSDDS